MRAWALLFNPFDYVKVETFKKIINIDSIMCVCANESKNQQLDHLECSYNIREHNIVRYRYSHAQCTVL